MQVTDQTLINYTLDHPRDYEVLRKSEERVAHADGKKLLEETVPANREANKEKPPVIVAPVHAI